jgi:hypothetical protein
MSDRKSEKLARKIANSQYSHHRMRKNRERDLSETRNSRLSDFVSRKPRGLFEKEE